MWRSSSMDRWSDILLVLESLDDKGKVWTEWPVTAASPIVNLANVLLVMFYLE